MPAWVGILGAVAGAVAAVFLAWYAVTAWLEYRLKVSSH